MNDIYKSKTVYYAVEKSPISKYYSLFKIKRAKDEINPKTDLLKFPCTSGVNSFINNDFPEE